MIEGVYERWAAWVLAMCYRRAGPMVAEDLAQEVWLRVVRYYRDNPNPPLQSMIRSVYVDWLRQLPKVEVTELDVDMAVCHDDQSLPMAADVVRSLKTLTDLQRQVMGLVVYGYSDQEIAEKLGYPRERVKHIRHRARAKLLADTAGSGLFEEQGCTLAGR